MSKAEETLALYLRAEKLDGWEREYRFGAMAAGGPGKGLRARLDQAGLKDWRFDFAHPGLGIAVEVEGGGWTGGRHTRGAGFEEDLRKYDAAARLGWKVYRCSPAMVENGQAVETIRRLMDLSRRSCVLCGAVECEGWRQTRWRTTGVSPRLATGSDAATRTNRALTGCGR